MTIVEPIAILPSQLHISPKWGSTTKLVVALSLVAVGIFLLARFLDIVSPILLAFILAYLFYPIADAVRKYLRIPWRFSVTVVYLIVLLLLLGSLASGGLAIFTQVQHLIDVLQKNIATLPDFLNNLTAHAYKIGPFELDFRRLDVSAINQQIIGSIQPILTTASKNVLNIASSAATMVGWMFFILLLSYFMLAESNGLRLFYVSIPGYTDDFNRLGGELNRIWNAFLRNQLTIVLLTIAVYNILLAALGVNYFFGLSLLAGMARFIPYVGPLIAWTSYGLVAFFQGSTIFGLSPLWYVALVVGAAWFMDTIMDNVVVPRLMANALRVHPAAVMVSALVAFNLLGVVGMILAAPVLASFKLFLEYLFAKLFDQDPWANIDVRPAQPPVPAFIPQVQERYADLQKQIARMRSSAAK